MSKILPYLAVLLIGIAVCFFWMKGCGKESDVQVIQDSLNTFKKKNDTIVALTTVVSHKFDSIRVRHTHDSLGYTHKIDSQSHIITVLRGQTKITKDSVVILYRQLKEFYDNKDTVALLAAYTELRNQWSQLNQQLFNLQIARDSSDNIRTAEIERLNGVITSLEGQIVEFKDLLIQCTDNASNLAATGNKALKKAKMASLWSKIGGGLAAILAVLLIAHK